MVSKIFRKRHTAVGARPGTLVIDEKAEKPTIHVFDYSDQNLREHEHVQVDDVRNLIREDARVWIDVRSLGDESVLRTLGEILALHPLALEDIVNVPQRPKVELHDEHLLVVTRMVSLKQEHEISSEQVSILVGKSYVATFQERPGDVFEPIRLRLRQAKGPIRKLGPDYLAYALLDAVIDGYYPVLEAYGEYLEDLEDRIVETPSPSALKGVHAATRDLLALRRGIWPQREAVNSLLRDESPFVTEEVKIYLRDCYDHCVQIMDAVETYRELVGGLMDVYLSSVGNRQNEVMKVLTIMASIFIPLTFLAGIYGMNFQHMPELGSRWGYPILLAIMLAVATTMFVFFRRRGWIGSPRQED